MIGRRQHTFASDLKRIVRAMSMMTSKGISPECFCAVSAVGLYEPVEKVQDRKQ